MIDRRRARAAARRILFRNGFSFGAMIGIFLVACAVGLYTLEHQRLRLPIINEPSWTLKAEFTTALLCRTLGVHRSAYYTWLAGRAARLALLRAEELLAAEIALVHA